MGTPQITLRVGEQRPGFLRLFISEHLPRGLALFFGAFALLNVLGDLRVARFDANLWWIDLRWFPAWLAKALIAGGALCLIQFGLGLFRGHCWRRLTVFCAALLAFVCLVNAASFFVLLGRKEIASAMPLPLSLLVALLLLAIARAAAKPGLSNQRRLVSLVVCLGFAMVFPLAEMVCFGKTDYRRPADVAVVLGCRVYADGRPSDALKDRVATACRLYQQGLTRKLLFSGGRAMEPCPRSKLCRRWRWNQG